MKIKTIIKIYDVLVIDGYQPSIYVNIFGTWAYAKLTFSRDGYKESLFSKTYSKDYILKNLDGIPFTNRVIE